MLWGFSKRVGGRGDEKSVSAGGGHQVVWRFVALLAVFAAVPHAFGAEAKRTLVLAIDGLSYESFQVARARGLFKRFAHAGRHIAPYPSMSEPSWNEIWGGKKIFPNQGNVHTLEAASFDLDKYEVNSDPRNLFVRYGNPYSFMRAFDTFFNPFLETLLYFPGESIAEKELVDTEKTILENGVTDHYIAYLSSVDAIAHTQPLRLYPLLKKVDALIERLVANLTTAKPLTVFLVSDHGNVGAFEEGAEAEPYLTRVTLNAAAEAAGLVIQPTELKLDRDINVPIMALGNYAPVYFKDLAKRRAFAEAALKLPFVSLVTYPEGPKGRRTVTVLAKDGEARVAIGGEAKYVAYVPLRGNPLGIAPSLFSAAGKKAKWIAQKDLLAATADGPYPDSLYRVAMTALHQVDNEPDLIVNLSRGYCFDGPFSKFVRMVRTHGGLDAGSSFGLIASDTQSVPSHVRSEQVLSVFGLTPYDVFRKSDGLFHREPRDGVAVASAQAKRGVDTLVDDMSPEMLFYRTAKAIGDSVDVISAKDLKDAQAALGVRADGPEQFGQRIKEFSETVEQIDLAKALRSVDSLVSLKDSLLTEEAKPKFLAELQNGLGRIPGLEPVGRLKIHANDGSNSEPSALQVDAVRRLAMKIYSAPYLLDRWLNLPEAKYAPDRRDFTFAKSWAGTLRSAVVGDPAWFLKKPELAQTLFRKLFEERELFHDVQPAPLSLTFNPLAQDFTVVFIPGTYNELFDQEIFAAGLRSVRDTLGARVIYADVDGRCGTGHNAKAVLEFLTTDTRRRVERGYGTPRYLIVGYSKGAVDATEMLLLDKNFSRSQVLGLVSIASPHAGTPIVEKFDVPAKFTTDFVMRALPEACREDNAVKSLMPATRAAFWSKNLKELLGLTRYFSLTLESDVKNSHPWMKISKSMARFGTPNDGVVPRASSFFPEPLAALNLGVFTGDHLAGIAASSFPQAAFLDAVVLFFWETQATSQTNLLKWYNAVAEQSPLLLTDYHKRQMGKALLRADLDAQSALFKVVGPFPPRSAAEGAQDLADSWYDTVSRENAFQSFALSQADPKMLQKFVGVLGHALRGSEYALKDVQVERVDGRYRLRVPLKVYPHHQFWNKNEYAYHEMKNLGDLARLLLSEGLVSEKDLLEDPRAREALLPKSTRKPETLPLSNVSWNADTFVDIKKFEDFIRPFSISPMKPLPGSGVRFVCDHTNFTEFRKEYALFYETSSPNNTDNNLRTGYSQVEEVWNDKPTSACDLKSVGSSIRMTTLAYRFRPVDFPKMQLSLKVLKAVRGADPRKGGSGLDDSSFQVWYTLRNVTQVEDRRGFNPKGEIKLMGYYWSDPDDGGHSAPAGTRFENYYSRKNYVVATLPEAFQIAVGGGADSGGKWITAKRDFAEDFRASFPALKVEDWEVVAITFQTDSNDTKSESHVRFRELLHLPLDPAK